VKNYFDKDQSWMMVKNAYVLQHEQIHFNISELYARKIRKSADSLSQKKRYQSATPIEIS
jgi:predicted secreted Zn-dependent protease